MTHTRQDDRIPPQATATLVIAALSEFNFLIAPSEISAAAGRDAWISVILSFIGLGIGCWLILEVMRSHPDRALPDIAQALLGRTFGILVVFFYVHLWLVRVTVLAKVQAGLYSLTLLPTTPNPVIIFCILALTTYLARHGIEPIARFCLMVIPFFLGPMTLLILIAAAEMDMIRIFPIAQQGAAPILSGAAVAFAQGPGIETLLIVGAYFTRFQGVRRAAFAGLACVAGSAAFLTVVLIGCFGAENVSKHVLPTLSLVETIDVPGFTGFHLDPVFTVLWSIAIFTSAALSHYAAAAALRDVLPFSSLSWPTYLAGAAAFALALIPTGFQQLLDWNLHWRIAAVPVGTLGIPLILYVANRIRGANRREGRSVLR